MLIGDEKRKRKKVLNIFCCCWSFSAITQNVICFALIENKFFSWHELFTRTAFFYVMKLVEIMRFFLFLGYKILYTIYILLADYHSKQFYPQTEKFHLSILIPSKHFIELMPNERRFA